MKSARAVAATIAATLVIGAATVGNAAATQPTVPVNGPLVENFLMVQTTVPQPGPEYVVYRSDHETNNAIELWSHLVGGAGTAKLAALDAAKRGVQADIAATPDGNRIVYRADTTTYEHFQLYSVPTDGGTAPTTLTGGTGPSGFGKVTDFVIAPDGSRVVFRADRPGAGALWGLYSQDLDDGSRAPELLSDPAATGHVQAGYVISANSSKVVYRIDNTADTEGGVELYSRSIDGHGTPTKLNGALLSGSVGADIDITPDSGRVVYQAAQDTANLLELHSVSISGGGSTRISGDLTGRALASDVEITASQRAIYRTRPLTSFDGWELYSVPVGGGQPVMLNPPLADGRGVGSFKLTPDRSLVVYRGDLDVNGSHALYTRKPDGSGAHVRLSMPPANGLEVWDAYLISNDGQHVVFHAGGTQPDSPIALYAARIDGTGPVLLHAAPASSTHADNLMLQRNFRVTPDSKRVVYLSETATAGVFQLYSRPIDGSGSPTTFEFYLTTWTVPTANDDTASATSGLASEIGVLANDHVAAGTLDLTSVTKPSHGAAERSAGSVLYTADSTFAGTDQFTYKVCATNDPTQCDEATVTVTVTTAPPPIAVDDTALTTAGIGLQIEVLANDHAQAGNLDPISVTITADPANGNATTRDDGIVVYTPKAGFWGADQFTYQVCLVHDAALCGHAIGAVTVGAVRPTAAEDIASTPAGTPVRIAVLANDHVGAGTLDPASVAVTVVPAHGTAAPGAGGVIRYTPKGGFAGHDGFMYEVCVKGAPAFCTEGIVNVTVTAKPKPPKPPVTQPPVTQPPVTQPPVTQPPVTQPPTNPKAGYWLLESDGDLRAFGGAPALASVKPDLAPGASAVALAAQPGGKGLWVLASDGDIIARGTATDFGRVDLGALTKPGERVSTMSASPDGAGLWVFTTAGRIISFGTAVPASRTAGSDAILALTLDGPIIDSVATPSGKGAYLVASDGGVFTVGDATFIDSVRGALTAISGPPGLPAAPVVGIVPDPDGHGYWNVASDGGVFAFGSPFRGSLPSVIDASQLAAPVNGMVAYGNGYLLVAGDGGVFTFSNLPFAGSAAGTVDSTVVDIAARA